MKKIYILAITFLASLAVNAQQTTIDISTVNSAYTTTVDGTLVIDVAKTAAKVAAPLLSYPNPLKGLTFTEAQISFDIYNYSTLNVLGSLLAFYDSSLGRMYFSNGSYWGYNATGGWFDANLIAYGVGTDFLGSNTWKNVKLQFTATGYAMYVDNVLAFNQNSTNVTIAGGFTAFSSAVSFLQNASTFVIGTGSWWSDNTQADGVTYWDAQKSYIKNIKLTPNFSSITAVNKVSDNNAQVISEEFFTIAGTGISNEYKKLKPGAYIRKVVFNDGSIKTNKIAKVQ